MAAITTTDRTPPTRFAAELARRGWWYHRFAIEYRQTSRRELGEELTLTEKQFKNWFHGRVKTRPQPKAAKILEVMFPPWSVAELLAAPAPQGGALAAGTWPADMMAAVLAADARESARFARRAAATNVGELTLDQLQADVARLARDYVSRPLFELFLEIRTLRNDVFTLLEGRQHPAQARDLYLVAGYLCGLTTHIALDLGHYDAAATQARTAHLCADLAGHHGLRAWVYSIQSLIAYWDNHDHQAAEYARAGCQYPIPGSIGARLAGLEARALARTGDAPRALAALGAASDARAAMTAPDELAGVFTFPTAKQAVYAGTTYLALGGTTHLRRAVEHSTEAIRLYQGAANVDQSSGDLLAAHLDLAAAHLAGGEIDAVAEKLGYVLAAPIERRTASIRTRMRTLSSTLGQPAYRGSPAILGLREQIHAFARPVLPAPDPTEP